MFNAPVPWDDVTDQLPSVDSEGGRWLSIHGSLDHTTQ